MVTIKLMLRVAAAAAAAALLVVAAGCGEELDDPSAPAETTTGEELSNQRYAEEVRQTMVGLGSRLQAIEVAGGSESFRLGEGELKRLGETIRRTVDEFGAIKPPDDAQEGHDRILAALEDFSSKYSDVFEAVKADGEVSEESFTALRTATFELQDQYLQAQENLTDAGIEMGATPVGG